MSTTHRRGQLYSLAALARALGMPLTTAIDWRENGYLKPHPAYAHRARPRYSWPTKRELERARAAACKARKKAIQHASQVKATDHTKRRLRERLVSFSKLREVLGISVGELREHVEAGRISPAEISRSGYQRWFQLPTDPDATRQALRDKRFDDSQPVIGGKVF